MVKDAEKTGLNLFITCVTINFNHVKIDTKMGILNGSKRLERIVSNMKEIWINRDRWLKSSRKQSEAQRHSKSLNREFSLLSFLYSHQHLIQWFYTQGFTDFKGI